MKPKGKRGLAQVKKLGRRTKTGGFAKIASKASQEYGSQAAGQRVAGAIFQNMVKKRMMMRGKQAAKMKKQMNKY